ncbi:Putative nucleoside phosphorylase domain-containing protein [Colletotrichum destructivum]|uniref:Nucleoside phosphorylase domain-containing protein n=1 Tax=Colletotrichum destructivum TaxID=34406 RepID=A0AAX4IUC2_9PEZI|nr:Putative nucleoside phosphorylase domain-containing protein [Colletotrichum destructivum]
MDYLQQEVDRQLGLCERFLVEPSPWVDLQGTDGLATLEKQPAEFHGALKALNRQIHHLPRIDDLANCDKILEDASLLWKLPAFCKPTPFLIDPGGQISRAKAIQSSRAARDPTKTSVDDIWTHKALESWICSKHSHILLVQGQYLAIKRMHRFGLEITVLLQTDVPTVLLLQSYMKPTENKGYAELQPEQVVRQLAIQALQQVSTPTPIIFLARAVELFQRAKSLNDWLKVFRFASSQLAHIHVVLDLGILSHDPNAIARLSTALHDLVHDCQLQSPSTILKVMLLTPRRTELSESDLVSLLPVGPLKRLPQPMTLASLKQRLVSTLKDRKLNLPSTSAVTESYSKVLSPKMDNRHSISKPIVQAFQLGQKPGQKPQSSDVDHTVLLQVQASNANGDNRTPTDLATDQSFQADFGRCTIGSPNSNDLLTKAQSKDNPVSEITSPAGGYNRNSITVAIVCALTLEADAVCALFDEHWDDDVVADLVAPGDTNSYSMGKIGRHHVVLIHMAGMGKSYSATAAAYCKASFPGIGVALLVGICGGVPKATAMGIPTIVLGDVIISEGVIPLDLGRQYPDMFLRKNGMMDVLGRPPTVIRAKLAKLQTRHDRKSLNEKISKYLNDLEDEFGDGIRYPGTTEDKLFEGNYQHKHDASFGCLICNDKTKHNSVCENARTSTCDELNCDNTRLVLRERLSNVDTVQPIIHFGLVASGDQVMKSGEHRDQIAAREGVIAFEMEAAGAWEHFSCVIIKGVCDYADSHKHKKWQNYAAATAAACMKAFLDKWSFRA